MLRVMVRLRVPRQEAVTTQLVLLIDQLARKASEDQTQLTMSMAREEVVLILEDQIQLITIMEHDEVQIPKVEIHRTARKKVLPEAEQPRIRQPIIASRSAAAPEITAG